LEAQILGTSEYLFGLKEARMAVYGFKQGETTNSFAAMQPFSLRTRAFSITLRRRCSSSWREGHASPISDLYILCVPHAEIGLGFNPTGGHTGRFRLTGTRRKITEAVVVPWLTAELAPPRPPATVASAKMPVVKEVSKEANKEPAKDTSNEVGKAMIPG